MNNQNIFCLQNKEYKEVLVVFIFFFLINLLFVKNPKNI